MTDNKTPRLTMPTVSVDNPDFKWSRGADVQATWRRFGWAPPSEGREPLLFTEKLPEVVAVRRVQ